MEANATVGRIGMDDIIALAVGQAEAEVRAEDAQREAGFLRAQLRKPNKPLSLLRITNFKPLKRIINDEKD